MEYVLGLIMSWGEISFGVARICDARLPSSP
jgi:hypothetical protein